ncbi:hypothetical protein [Pedobacter sp. NJ-S-72]
MSIELKVDDTLIYTLPDKVYPKSWREIGNLQNKSIGDELMDRRKFLAVKTRSAINKLEYNYLLNPLFSGYHDLVMIRLIEELAVDARLVK